MKVLLIYPDVGGREYTGIPLGIFYLAGMLEKHGISCDCVDGRIEGRAAVEKAVGSGQYDVIGVSCLTNTRWHSFGTAELPKKMRLTPMPRVVMGGPHVTVMHEQIRDNFPWVDACIAGDGEAQMLDYVTTGKITGRVLGIDEVPWPAWDKVKFHLYPKRGRKKRDNLVVNGIKIADYPKTSVQSSRGCTAHCRFCSWTTWANFRVRNPESVAEELNLLKTRYGQRNFEFIDDCFGGIRAKALELAERLKRLKIAWAANVRVDRVDEEVLQAYKRAGCYALFMGVESGDGGIISASMHKGTTIEQAEWAIRRAKELGIWASVGIMVGMPGETEQSILNTRDFLRRTKPDEVNTTGGVFILPGTALFQQAAKEGFIDDSFWLTNEPHKIYLNPEFTEDDLLRWKNILVGYNAANKLKLHIKQIKSSLGFSKGFHWTDTAKPAF